MTDVRKNITFLQLRERSVNIMEANLSWCHSVCHSVHSGGIGLYDATSCLATSSHVLCRGSLCLVLRSSRGSLSGGGVV